MKKDNKFIQDLYENIYEIKDFFDVGDLLIEQYDWDEFFGCRDFALNKCLLEDFKIVSDGLKTTNGFQDSYEIELRNGQTFMLYLDYESPKNTQEKINKRIIELEHKNNPILAKTYEKNFQNLGSEEMVCVIQFKDSKDRHELTGEVGMSAKELFSSVREGIFDSFITKKRISDLRGFMIRVSNSEKKRMILYRKMVERFLKNEFPNIFEDDVTESSHGYSLLVATR